MQTLQPPDDDAAASPKTPDLVWAKTTSAKGAHTWWPARVIASSDGRLHVARFGEATTFSCHVSQTKPFFDPGIMRARRRKQSEAFVTSFEEAVAFACKCLQSQLTCHCHRHRHRQLERLEREREMRPQFEFAFEFEVGSRNFTPLQLVDCIRDAALSVDAVNLEDSVRLKSWVFALRSRAHIGTEGGGGGGGGGKARIRKKKRARESHIAALETESCCVGEEAAEAGSGSGKTKRERKKSKYLSPPYAVEIQRVQEEVHSEEAFSVRDTFNDFLFTAMDPLYLKCKTTSAKLLRFFFHKYRDAMFAQGTQYTSYANHKRSRCIMARSDLTTPKEELLERETSKDNTDNGAHQPKKRARPGKEEKSLSSLGSGMPSAEQSEQKEHERKDLTNNSIGLGTVLNFANGSSYEFLEEARAQMMKTSSLENGNKQSQEQGSSKECNTGNGDGTRGTGRPKQRGRRKNKIAQAHYSNPAALLLEFSKPNTTNGTATGTGTGTNLPSRDQLLSTFSKFGLLVEAQSDVHSDAHTACVVFACSADAEVAYNSPDKLGLFGPPYASCRLRYLPPISDSTTPTQPAQAHQIPAQQQSARPQLSDIRKNLEIMISSLTGGSGLPVKGEPGLALDGIRPEVRGSLLGEMQGLLMKVEKKLHNGGASSCAPQP